MARHLAESIQLANVSADKLRSELFSKPRYDAQENAILNHLMNYIAEEFLSAGVSVVYDSNAVRLSQRRKMRDLARKHKAEHLLVWLQIDNDSAFTRTQGRDRRTADDKFAEGHTRASFDRYLSVMQHPKGEDYLVVSGKHTYSTQKATVVNKLYQMGLVSSGTVRSNVAVPGLVNLVPNKNRGRVDLSRRNITID